MSQCSSCGAECAPDQPLCEPCASGVLAQVGVASVAGFQLLRQLGAGRYGTSWLSYCAQGVVVVKILSSRAATADGARRFLAEAFTASKISAPTVARLLTAGQLKDGRLYLVYEYGGDQSLGDVLRAQARLSPPRALDMCAEIADGLAVAHAQGIVHRDLKAANVGIWIDEDGSELVRLLDLPTWAIHTRAGLHEPGALPLSSAATASPEEARGEEVDRRADLYAVGVILYQALTGRLPITGATSAELLKSHRDHPPLSLRDAGRKLPQLEEVVETLLRKRPHERPDSAVEVAEMLRELAWTVEGPETPRPARASGPPAETPLPPEAPRLGAVNPVATPSAPVKPVAKAASAPSKPAAKQPDPHADKTPPGGFLSPQDDLNHDAPTPAEGLPTPPDPEPKAMQARSPAPAARATAEQAFEEETTPPDPVLASVTELPAPPAALVADARKTPARPQPAPSVAAAPRPAAAGGLSTRPQPIPPAKPLPPSAAKPIPQATPASPVAAKAQPKPAAPSPAAKAHAATPARPHPVASLQTAPTPPPQARPAAAERAPFSVEARAEIESQDEPAAPQGRSEAPQGRSEAPQVRSQPQPARAGEPPLDASASETLDAEPEDENATTSHDEQAAPRADAPRSAPKMLRRRRGANAAFSGPGHRRTPLQGQLLKYGLGLIVLLALLVYGAMHVLREPEAPKRAKGAAAAREPRPGSRKAAVGADGEPAGSARPPP